MQTLANLAAPGKPHGPIVLLPPVEFVRKIELELKSDIWHFSGRIPDRATD